MPKEEQKSSPGRIFLTIIIVFITLIGLFLFFTFLGLLAAIVGLASSGEIESYDGNVAHLYITGIILTQGQSSFIDGTTVTSSSYIVKQLEKIQEDDSIDAIFLEINSPGGSGVASDEIAKALANIDKPTVAYIRESGASGAYWVASSSDYIVANQMSIVGSIGVIGSFLDFSEFIDDYNVTYQRFVAGDNKDFGSPFRTPTQEERDRYQSLLDQLHAVFIDHVAQQRDLPKEHVLQLADGFIMSGQDALSNGLVDSIGTKQTAIAYLESELNQSVTLRPYQQSASFWQLLAQALQPQQPIVEHPIAKIIELENRPITITT